MTPDTLLSSPLFSPLDLGPLTLPNRFVMAPMTRGFSLGGAPGADVAAYYARRAAGGVGLIITEGTYIDTPSAGSSADVPRLEAGTRKAWSQVVAGVHKAGGRIFPQLWHLGATRETGAPPFPDAPVLSPSGLDLAGAPHGRAMTGDEIRETIAAFARSARFAREAGFDGVEIHGAHGYLVDQFLWERTNRREDGWGGSLENRSRFAVEVVAAIRQAVGPDYPIALRFSQWKGGHYEARPWARPEDLKAALQPVVDAGLSLFHVSTRRYWEPGFDGSALTLAGWTRQLFGLPVIAVGSVGLQAPYTRNASGPVESTGIGTAPGLFAQGEFDLIALGRALIGDPAWVARLRDPSLGPHRPYDPDMQARLI